MSNECEYHKELADCVNKMNLTLARQDERDVSIMTSLGELRGQIDVLTRVVQANHLDMAKNYVLKSEHEYLKVDTDKKLAAIYERMDVNLKHAQLSTYKLVGIIIGTSSGISALLFGVFNVIF